MAYPHFKKIFRFMKKSASKNPVIFGSTPVWFHPVMMNH